MPMRAPSICGCGRVVQTGRSCLGCMAARARTYEARRPSARERGYDSKWDRARADFLKANSVCVTCAAPARVVDHIIPHRGDKALFWRRSNWQPLCTRCHSSVKQRQERAHV